MKWYRNMKIGKKLISGFLLIALISAGMGVYALHDMKALVVSDTELYEKMTAPLSEIGTISTELQRMHVDVRDMITANTPEEIQKYIDKINARKNKISQLSNSFETTIISDKMEENFNNFIKAEKAFELELDQVTELAKQNRDAEAQAMIAESGSAGKDSRTAEDLIEKIMAQKVSDAKAKSALNSAKAGGTMRVMIGVILFTTLLSVLIGIFISLLIVRPLRRSVHVIREMSMGHFGERLDIDTKDEIGQMARAMDAFADELQTKVIGVMNQISDGNIGLEIQLKDEKDEITPALKKTIETIRALNGEVDMLIRAATEGKLEVRGDSSGYDGAWKDMIGGINGLIDAFVAPINVTAEYMERISKGDIPQKITDTYQGDFNGIKDSINGCIDVMNALLKEMNRLIQSTREGRLNARGDASLFRGDWGTLVQGVNDLIEAFVAPIHVTANYVDRISRGDIPAKITDLYYGDFNEIKNNLNGCIDVMNGLLNETSLLIRSAQEGKLDVRADAAPFRGDWGTLLSGVNNLVDAFVRPINVTSDYVDRISRGDIPAKITDTYYGDFNQIKDNLNNCIDIMNGLLTETNRLIAAAQEGQLDVRADATEFQGGWEELVNGVNRLVEAVVRPIKEVTAVMNEISRGNLKVSVQGAYLGEFGVLSGAVNGTAADLNSVVGEISNVIGAISEGNLAIDHVNEFKGDFASISDSLNTILESLNSVLGEINMAADQVSIGSKQVSDGSQALSQGTTEQASSVEELTASVSEVAAKTKKNAASAGEANTLTLTVRDSAELGNGHMKQMLEAMEEINESSNNISRIIKVIDDIAFQTNILALNAAVEAARAGQHGKGFAVVAEEVRTLAARSAEAAKETTDLIQGSIRKASGGMEIANNTARALDQIVEGVTKTVGIIEEIAKSSNEQATGISLINSGLNQVSQVVQTNAATAEESAASSEELSGQAVMLKEMVNRFRLRKIQGSAGSAVKLLSGLRHKEEAPQRIVLSGSEFDKY